MLVFWGAVAALSLLAGALVVGAAVRAARTPGEDDPTLGLYRRQMGEIDDLVERGLLDPAERRTAHAEAGRRLLSVADGGVSATVSGKLSRPAAAALVALIPAAALVIYLGIGAPGLPDQPIAGRIQAWRSADPATLGPAEMAAVLQEIVRERPNDVDGLSYLAQAQMAAGDPFLAASNLRSAIAIEPDRADLWLMLGSAIMADNQGSIVADAEAAFREALKREPTLPGARYYLGRARIENGATAEGLTLWRALLADLPAGMPGRDDLADEIAVVEQTGRLRPPEQPAADSAEMQAAIRSMVEGLAARLETDPDDAEGWVRLVRAYTVLGETAKRDEALAKARTRYKDQPEIMAALAQAAEAPQ
jgi:cytochrome c-type biogenesis protein CcmH